MPDTTAALAPPQVIVDGDGLRRAIKRIRHAASDGFSRPILNSILFQADGDAVRLVAADNFRLATLTLPVVAGDLAAVLPFCLGLDDADHLRPFIKRSIRGPLVIERSGQAVTFRVVGRSVTYLVVDGIYPDYQVVIKAADAQEDSRTVRVDPRLLAGMVGEAGTSMAMTVGGPNEVLVFAGSDMYDGTADGYREYLMPIRTQGAPLPAHYEQGFTGRAEPTDA